VHFVRIFALGLVAATTITACAKSNTSTNADQSSSGAATAAPTATAAAASAGQTAYTANCASCHQANGKGLTGSFPPLAGNPTISGDPKKVIHIVKYGLSGKIMVGPDSFNGIMPPWGSQLSDSTIANVITFIRTSWGNKGSAVTSAQVTAIEK
jgi:nitrite reductase (NO-forming)/hydroxylamine reductase